MGNSRGSLKNIDRRSDKTLRGHGSPEQSGSQERPNVTDGLNNQEVTMAAKKAAAKKPAKKAPAKKSK